MKRYFINLAALFLGLVLGGFATYASAETISATSSNYAWRYHWGGYETPSALCTSFPAINGVTQDFGGYDSAIQIWCKYANGPNAGLRSGIYTRGQVCDPPATLANGGSWCVGYTCPTGQNWTLSGATCTRPDCLPGQQRDANGVCQAVACPTGQYSSGYYGGSAPAYACASNGCGVSFTGSYPAGRDAQGNLYAQGSYSYTGGNQGDCTPGQGGAVSAPTTATATPSPTSPGPNGCAAGDGVITSSSGKVACVPAGTPGSSTPVPNSNTKTETFPDGSTKTTTNNQVCTGDGACQTITTTTVTNNSSGSPGMAGTPGTTTGTTEKPPSPTSSFCAENPSIQLCKGGMNEEVTQKQVRDELKKFNEQPNDLSGIEAAAASADSKKVADDAFKSVTDQFDAVAAGTDAASSAHMQTFRDSLASWWEPIPSSTCAAVSSRVGPWTWDFDPCPTAAKISEIGAFALWLMFAFGVFNLVTRKAE